MPDLFGGFAAQGGDAAHPRVFPARLVGQIVRAEPLHPVHEFDRVLGALVFEQGDDFAEGFAQEFRRETVQLGAGVGIVRIDADDRA